MTLELKIRESDNPNKYKQFLIHVNGGNDILKIVKYIGFDSIISLDTQITTGETPINAHSKILKR